ncbi:MAG: Nif3-like dinuclear metal center hexameric protein [Cyclobacteriaceae bacterium]|nr:Nif3-like dinuclear metal center hexameric protein [Cyclobacteriaceae bacterium]MCH8517066.1 Nif3-like dinuclear metal center hexameric protein [Cyclobacteriaceae bacterium]
MTQIKEIISEIERWAPPSLQEPYDNVGLAWGNPETSVRGVLIALEVTEAVIEEARDKNCQLIITHHPLIFKGLKSLSGDDYVTKTLRKAITHDIALYSVHTNLDNIKTGVNCRIGEMLELKGLKILSPKKDLMKITTFVPKSHERAVIEAMNHAGAGNIGNYADCSFTTEGTGRFKPSDESNPYIGKSGELEEVNECRVEMIFSQNQQYAVLKALKKHHPYEEVAYYLHALENTNQDHGAGMIGELAKPMEVTSFLNHVKKSLNLEVIKYTDTTSKTIKKVAYCGGAGSFLMKTAAKQSADVFFTGDLKHHDYFERPSQMLVLDIGHYESEAFTKNLIYDRLSEKFSNIALCLGQTITNPIKYYY